MLHVLLATLDSRAIVHQAHATCSNAKKHRDRDREKEIKKKKEKKKKRKRKRNRKKKREGTVSKIQGFGVSSCGFG